MQRLKFQILDPSPANEEVDLVSAAAVAFATTVAALAVEERTVRDKLTDNFFANLDRYIAVTNDSKITVITECKMPLCLFVVLFGRLSWLWQKRLSCGKMSGFAEPLLTIAKPNSHVTLTFHIEDEEVNQILHPPDDFPVRPKFDITSFLADNGWGIKVGPPLVLELPDDEGHIMVVQSQ